MAKTLALSIIAGAVLVSTTEAQAFDGLVELNLQIAPSTGDEVPDTFSPRLSAFIPLSDRFAISADLGLGVLSGIEGEDTEVNALNTFLGAHYLRSTDNVGFRVGFGVSFPTSRSDDDFSQAATILTSSPRGLFDLWLYAPKTISLVVPARIEATFGVGVAADAAAVLYISEDGDSITGQSLGGDTAFGFQLGGEAFVPIGLFDLGARLQFASVPTSDGDLTQVAINPFLRFEAAIITARAGFLFFIDEPLGPSFDDSRPFGLDFAVGIKW